jgi:hypothetical protein
MLQDRKSTPVRKSKSMWQHSNMTMRRGFRLFNLYAELLQFLGQNDPTLGDLLPHLYAASCCWRSLDKRMLPQSWSHTLTLGQPLPTLPLWLTAKLAVPLDLEQSYEQACHDLWLT